MCYALHKIMSSQNHAAKFAFFYLLSLIALIFMALSTGMIIFQIINKYVPDILNEYSGRYSDDALRFAISAIIISTPIFYLTTRQIHKNLFSGDLDKESGVRKWLTYFVLLITSVIMIGWLIGIVNSFLSGELTLKFILKALTAIGIAAIIFSFYLYDIKRDNVKGKKDNIIRIYFYVTLTIVIVSFIASLFVVESPMETRKEKLDQKIMNDFSMLESEISRYYNEHNVLPESLDIAQNEYGLLKDETLQNEVTGEKYEYKIVDEKNYELCTTFYSSNKDKDESRYEYLGKNRLHDAGYQCLNFRVYNRGDVLPPKPLVD